jgi:hypothetical protein
VGGAIVGVGIMKSNRSLNPYQALDRAAMVLGLVSIISAAFLFVHGAFQLVQIGAVGLVVAIVLGLLAIAAGLLAEGTLMIAGGVGFLLAGAAQLALLAGGSSGFLGGNASTFSLWLGLGAGLIAIGSVPRPEMAEEMPATE